MSATPPTARSSSQAPAPAINTAVNHALIINSSGVWTLHGEQVTRGPVADIDSLGELLNYLRTRQRLAPFGVIAQVWLVGETITSLLGLGIDYDDDDIYEQLADADGDDQLQEIGKKVLSDQVRRVLTGSFVSSNDSAGWILGPGADKYAGGPLIPLRYEEPGTTGKKKRPPFRVHLILEPYLWTVTKRKDFGILGNEHDRTTPAEDEMATTKELARRLRWMMDSFGTLPALTSAMSAANVLDAINSARRTSGKGVRVTEAGPLPHVIDPADTYEPEVIWHRAPTGEEIEAAQELVIVDQRASYLAAAGTEELGWGTPRQLGDNDLRAAMSQEKLPYGVWQVVLPAGAELGVDERLPMPHPRMRMDKAVTTWVSSVTMNLLSDSPADGGAGIDLTDLDVLDGYVYPHRGRMLEAWAKKLREARADALATDDVVLKKLVGSMYKAYVGRIANTELWSTYKAHHIQPSWHYTISASARRRGRRHAARIADEHGLYPVASLTDSWTYLIPAGLDLADHTGYLGRLELKRRAVLADDDRNRLAESDALSRALIDGLGVDTPVHN